MKEWAARFAEQLLKDNLQLEEFQVSLAGYEHFEEIVQKLEGLGCEVQVDRSKRRLIVTCPSKRPGGAGPRREGEQPRREWSYQAGRRRIEPLESSRIERTEDVTSSLLSSAADEQPSYQDRQI